MTFNTICKVGPVSFTVRELMKQVVSANSLTEAHDKAYWIQKALMEDPNQEIQTELNNILNEYHEEPCFSIVRDDDYNNLEPPIFLTNDIFVIEIESSSIDNDYLYIDTKRLWNWIYHYFVLEHKTKYDWLALFLFGVAKGIIIKEVNARQFCDQMNSWYGDYTENVASYSQVNCYQAGFFRSNEYKYNVWCGNKFPIPMGYKLRKNQKVEGFKRIHDICKSLEKNFDYTLIQVVDTNR